MSVFNQHNEKSSKKKRWVYTFYAFPINRVSFCAIPINRVSFYAIPINRVCDASLVQFPFNTK